MFKAVSSVILVICLLWQAGYVIAQPVPKAEGEPPPPEGIVVMLSDAIGPEIDREERDRYRLFPGIPDFLSARIIQRSDGIYVAWVIYEKGGQRQYRGLGLSKEVLKDLCERVGGILPAEVKAPETEAIPTRIPPPTGIRPPRLQTPGEPLHEGEMEKPWVCVRGAKILNGVGLIMIVLGGMSIGSIEGRGSKETPFPIVCLIGGVICSTTALAIRVWCTYAHESAERIERERGHPFSAAGSRRLSTCKETEMGDCSVGIKTTIDF